jgi:hypothetical protein
MLINVESPLRRLPVGLNREQTLCIDGVRVSAEIVDLAHSRLMGHLERLSEADCPQAIRHELLVPAVQDTWAIVDAVHRIRKLVRRMPHVKKSSPPLQVFLRASADVDRLRHIVQHLDTELPRLVSLGASVWGTLSWLVLVDRAVWRIRTCTIAAGTVFDSVHEIGNPAGQTFRQKVDHIVLRSSGEAVDISDVYHALAKFVRSMEATLSATFTSVTTFGSDLVTVLEMQILTDSDTVEK